MSEVEEQEKHLSSEEQQRNRIMNTVYKRLYCEAEAQLLENFKHTAGRPRDGFDALVMVCALARTTLLTTIGIVKLGPESPKDRITLLWIIETIGWILEHKMVDVSPEFPATADEMVAATKPHLNAETVDFCASVDAAFVRIIPMMLDMARHLAKVHPEEYAAFARLVAGDAGPIH